jgi:hypothetical protein
MQVFVCMQAVQRGHAGEGKRGDDLHRTTTVSWGYCMEARGFACMQCWYEAVIFLFFISHAGTRKPIMHCMLAFFNL